MAAFVCASEGTAPLGYGGWYNALWVALHSPSRHYILHTQTKIPQGTLPENQPFTLAAAGNPPFSF